MKTKPAVNLPFRIDRKSAEPLISQFARGVVRGMEMGVWKPGDILPTLDEFAAATGVSLIVVRRAIKKLVNDGLVNPRPGVGTVVLESSLRHWRGNVIVVDFEVRSHYFVSRVSGMLRDQLIRAGYLPSPVTVETKSYDLGPLESVLRQPARLAVVLGSGHGHVVPAAKMIAAAGVPIIAMSKMEVPGAIGRIYQSSVRAYRDFVRHCAESGVKRVGLVCFYPEWRRELAQSLRRRGIKVEFWKPVSFAGLDPIECIQRGAMDYFEKRLSAASAADLPELFYFDDDYATSAAMVSLLRHGVRIPEDVKIVTISHSGAPPPFPAPIARIETNPFEVGRALSDMALSYLSGWPVPQLTEIPLSYHPGATFCHARVCG